MDSTYPTYGGETYYYSNSDPESLAVAAGFSFVLILMFLVFTVGVYVLNSWLLSRVFKKAGLDAWKAWVPIYNTWVTLEIGGQAGALVLLSLIPFVGPIIAAVFIIIAMYNIGLKLDKSGVFVLLAIFLPLIWVIILAFDQSTWNESAGAPRKDQPQPYGYPPQTAGQPGYPGVPTTPPTAPSQSEPQTPETPTEPNPAAEGDK